MAEKESPKPVEKAEEKRQPGVFKRWRKLALSGLIGVSLALSPIKGNATQIKHAMQLPSDYAELYTENYSEGWNYLVKADEQFRKGKKSNGNADSAVEYFQKEYAKSKKVELIYILAYSNYTASMDRDTFEGTEQYLQKAIRLCESGLKKQGLLAFVDLKATILQNLAEMYSEAYNKQSKDEYRIKTVGYAKEFVSFYAKNRNRFEGTSKEEYEAAERVCLELIKRLQSN